MGTYTRLSFAKTLITIALLSCCASLFAQSNVIWTVKFVCGFERGEVPLLNDREPYPHRYEALKPGNYATVINISNVTLKIQTLAAIVSIKQQNQDPPFLLTRVSQDLVRPFNTPCISCTDITRALQGAGVPLQGEAIEGVVYLWAPDDVFEVQPVYTYSSQNAFERHIVWGFRPDGSFGPIRSLASQIMPGFPLIINGVAIANNFIAGSGAGGVGLGASIDIETVEPRKVPFTLDQFYEIVPLNKTDTDEL